jgi:tetratricopeptide (TPR) repeat protein
MRTPPDLAKQVKDHFDNRDFEGLIRVIDEILRKREGPLPAEDPLRAAEQSLRDEKLREEFEIHVENLKNEAMKQFDQELYGECLRTFRFLCELEPDNRTLRDYLQLCRQLVPEPEGPGAEGGETGADQNTVLSSAELPRDALSAAEPHSAEGHTAGGSEKFQDKNELQHVHLGMSETDGERSLPAESHFNRDATTSQLPRESALNSSFERIRENQKPERTDSRNITGPAKTPPANEALGQSPVSAAQSVRAGYKFGLAAAAILVAAILTMAYFKGHGGAWHGSGENQPVESRAKEISRPEQIPNPALPQDFWLQKAESAAALGHHVSPPSENAVAYCNRILALAPGDPKAHSLKEASINEAVIQAQKSIARQQFTEAREIYSSLLQFSEQQPDQFPLTFQELKNELEKLELTVYPVVHDHLFGSCKGHLKFNAYVISFVPAGGSTDEFTEPFTQVTLFSPGKRLKIQIRARTYHFQSDLESKDARRERLNSIFQDLKRRMAQRKTDQIL